MKKNILDETKKNARIVLEALEKRETSATELRELCGIKKTSHYLKLNNAVMYLEKKGYLIYEDYNFYGLMTAKYSEDRCTKCIAKKLMRKNLTPGRKR